MINKVRDSIYMQVDASTKSVNKTSPYFTYSEGNGYSKTGGYVVYWPGYINLNEN